MEPQQKFCLTWKDYNANFSKEFGEFRKHEDFFDVTLACEENSITAHKIVLSAASDFFKNILRKHKHEHPLIYLTEVKFSDLQAILDFIYTGETEVAEKDLENVLATATRFKVKGLTDGMGAASESLTTIPAIETTRKRIRIAENIMAPVMPEEKKTKIIATSAIKSSVTPVMLVGSESTTIIKSEQSSDPESNLPRAVRTTTSGAEALDISSFLSPEEQQEFVTESTTVTTFPKTTTVVQNVIDSAGVSQDYLNNKNELDRQCNELMVSSYDSSVGKTVWQCAQCHYSSKLRYTVKEHVETHISGFSHQCPLCDKTCNTRNALRVHTIRKHSNKAKAEALSSSVQQHILP